MEAKDTVIKNEDIQELYIPCETCHIEPFWRTGNDKDVIECMECIALKHREAQAEISFKVGKTLGVVETMKLSLKAMEDMKKAGIKEVVEWGNEICTYFDHSFPYIKGRLRRNCDKCLQAKKREWGINDQPTGFSSTLLVGNLRGSVSSGFSKRKFTGFCRRIRQARAPQGR